MSRTPTQNVSFQGPSSGDDLYEPPGRKIAQTLRAHLQAGGLAADEAANWRDCGWSLNVTFPELVLQIAISEAHPQMWVAQVAVLGEPGLFGRLFGRKFANRAGDVLFVAQRIHDWLQQSGYRNIRWRINGFPIEVASSPEPVCDIPTAR